jgi:ABC-type antimicrobial peptide transport system permease subunit
MRAWRESVAIALGAIRLQASRSMLAGIGIVIGIVTVVLVASVLANLRNQVALLFRELGTENIFAFHLSGDPYSGPSESEAQRRALDPAFAVDIARLAPDAPNDFNLSSSDQIIRTLDQVSIAIGLLTVGLAGVSLFIGGIGIANVMVIAVTERTREIGLRLAVGAPRAAVLRQFLVEAAVLSGLGGLAGVALALVLGWIASLVLAGFSAVPPLWAVVAGLVTSVAVGVVAGYLPARRAAGLNPVDALRYE